jgi:hypothetical protein
MPTANINAIKINAPFMIFNLILISIKNIHEFHGNFSGLQITGQLTSFSFFFEVEINVHEKHKVITNDLRSPGNDYQPP